MWRQRQWVLAAICFAVEFKSFASLHMQSDMVKPENKDQALQKKGGKIEGGKKGKAAVTWSTAPGGQTCAQKCTSLGKQCDESALRSINTDTLVRNLAGTLTGVDCSTTHPILSLSFPGIISGDCTAKCKRYLSLFQDHTDGSNAVMFLQMNRSSIGAPGQCAKAMPNPGSTCSLGPLVAAITRFCPCGNPNAYGDPHLTNMHGESFDIVREGVNTLLLLPKKADVLQNTTLRVDASIEHPGNGSKCGGYFIVRLWIKGTLLGEDIEVSTNGWDVEGKDNLAIKAGSTTFNNQADVASFVSNGKYSLTLNDERNDLAGQQHVNNRLKFASLTIHLKGADLIVDWSTGKNKPNSLGFRATHLSELGNEWGGLLGADDHNWVSSFDPECRKTENYEQVAQLLHIEHQGLWSASASLL